MRQISWELADGFPLDQGAMKFIQDEMFDRLMATITYWQNSLSENHFIITGMDRVGPNGETISAGWCFLGGKLLYYPGGAYPGNGCVIRPVLSETNVEYQDGIDRPAYKFWTATVMLGGSGEGMLYQGAKRVPKAQALTWANLAGIPTNLVYDSNYVHTDNNFTDALLAKLNGIHSGAEKNVQSDWNETDPNSDAFIRNKPTDMMRPVVRGRVLVGDIGIGVRPLTVTGDLISAEVVQSISVTDERIVVNFPVVEGYTRIVNCLALGNWNASNDTIMTLGPANSNNFEIYLRGEGAPIQNIQIEITLLK